MFLRDNHLFGPVLFYNYFALSDFALGSTAEAARIIYPTEAQTIIITKGQSLILECVASGIPTPHVTWTKDGSSVSGYNKTRFLLSNLLIDAISEEDSGTYSCMADNGVRKAAASVILYNVQVFGAKSYNFFSIFVLLMVVWIVYLYISDKRSSFIMH